MVIWSLPVIFYWARHALSVDFWFPMQKPLLVFPDFSETTFGQLIQHRTQTPFRGAQWFLCDSSGPEIGVLDSPFTEEIEQTPFTSPFWHVVHQCSVPWIYFCLSSRTDFLGEEGIYCQVQGESPPSSSHPPTTDTGGSEVRCCPWCCPPAQTPSSPSLVLPPQPPCPPGSQQSP